MFDVNALLPLRNTDGCFIKSRTDPAESASEDHAEVNLNTETI